MCLPDCGPDATDLVHEMRERSHETSQHRRIAARGDRRGDAARPVGLLPGRGHRRARRLGRRVHRHARPGGGVPRPDAQHADRRAGLLRRGRRGGDHGDAADRRRPVRRLPLPGHGPDRQQRRQAAVHVGRHDQGPDGDARPGRRDRPRLAARPEHGALLHRRAGDQGRRGLQRLRRQGHPQVGRARRQPGADLRAQAALRLEGRAHRAGRRRRDQRRPRGRLHRPARPRGGAPRRAAT